MSKEFFSLEQLKQYKNVETYDAAENAFDRPPLPQPGITQVKIGYSDKEEGYIQKVTDKESGAFRGYLLHLTAMVTKGGDKDTIIPIYWSTTLRRGRKSSEVSTILSQLGVLKGSVKVSHEQLVALISKVINKGLLLWTELDWRGSIKIGDGEYQDIYRSKLDFQKGKDGKYKEPGSYTKNGETYSVYTQVQARNWWVNEPKLETDDEEVDIEDDEVEEELEVVKEVNTKKDKAGAKQSTKVKGVPVVEEEEKEAKENDDEEFDFD